MIVRYIPADPAGNLTAIVLSPVAPQARAAVAARMMARCPEGFEQVGFAEADSLTGEFPRLCMMGGEFCGNAARAFACYAAGVRGRGETRLSVAISGAKNPVPVEIEPASGRAYAQMPLPCALDRLRADGRDIPLVRMEGIDHALLLNETPSPELAERVLAAMPWQDAQGVLFVQGGRMTPLVYVPATDTRVWESSCGSGTVALAWYLARRFADGAHVFAFDEPGGRLEARVAMAGGRAARIEMGGLVKMSGEKKIEL